MRRGRAGRGTGRRARLGPRAPGPALTSRVRIETVLLRCELSEAALAGADTTRLRAIVERLAEWDLHDDDRALLETQRTEIRQDHE